MQFTFFFAFATLAAEQLCHALYIPNHASIDRLSVRAPPTTSRVAILPSAQDVQELQDATNSVVAAVDEFRGEARKKPKWYRSDPAKAIIRTWQLTYDDNSLMKNKMQYFIRYLSPRPRGQTTVGDIAIFSNYDARREHSDLKWSVKYMMKKTDLVRKADVKASQTEPDSADPANARPSEKLYSSLSLYLRVLEKNVPRFSA
jgi:hypothetical protein